MKEAIIISCGKKKKFSKTPIEARFLYIGGYFKLCYKYAEFLNKDNIYIFSAKYGIIKNTDKIDFYNESFKLKNSTLNLDILKNQLAKLHAIYSSITYILGESYLDKILIREQDIVLFKGVSLTRREKAIKDIIIKERTMYKQEDLF